MTRIDQPITVKRVKNRRNSPVLRRLERPRTSKLIDKALVGELNLSLTAIFFRCNIMDFDLFISYASEDSGFVRPLAIALRQKGYNLWYDEFVLRVGDSLTERIDYGLANSAAGIFVISPAFVAKPWPKRELAGFTARHLSEAVRLIPL